MYERDAITNLKEAYLIGHLRCGAGNRRARLNHSLSATEMVHLRREWTTSAYVETLGDLRSEFRTSTLTLPPAHLWRQLSRTWLEHGDSRPGFAAGAAR
jgi:hypothetical protein